jgi:CRISPR-associated protein Csc1
MRCYHCMLTFHDNLFYETRAMGRLYETGRLLHNIALCYALGLAQTPYFHGEDVPAYGEELAAVNATGVYVTPAAGKDVRYAIHTFKLGDETSGISATTVQERRNQNRPSYGRAKEIAVGSTFTFGVLSVEPLELPLWIRMGIWMSKAHLEAVEVPLQREDRRRVYVVSCYPLNPADLPDSAALHLFDLVSMRPSSLVENALVEADAWWVGQIPGKNPESIRLPADLSYRIPAHS